MYVFSGTFGPSTIPIQLTTVQHIVKKAEFFAVTSWVSGNPSYGASYNMGLESGALPYLVGSGSPLTLDYGQHGTMEDARNFFLRGTNGNGYYCIIHP